MLQNVTLNCMGILTLIPPNSEEFFLPIFIFMLWKVYSEYQTISCIPFILKIKWKNVLFLVSNSNMQDTVVYMSLKKTWISIFKKKHLTIWIESIFRNLHMWVLDALVYDLDSEIISLILGVYLFIYFLLKALNSS